DPRRRRVRGGDVKRAPEPVRERYADWRWSLVDRPDESLPAWRLEHPGGTVHYLKVGPAGSFPSRLGECERLRWARRFLSVPEVLDCGADGTTDWLVTAALPGLDAPV